MNSSLFIGATGLKGLSQGMGVIGNNLANVSTYGFKQQNIQYSDLIYSSQGNLGSGWGSQEDSFVTTGEIGHGMAVDSVRSFFLQGSIESTNTVSDLALNGKGFFQVTDEYGEEFYTRTGDFILDQEGFMTTPTGMNLMGYQYDENGNLGGLAKIQLDRFGTIPAKATSSVNFQMNLGSVEDNTVDGDNPYFSLLTTYNATAKPPLAGNAASYQQSVTVYDAEGNKHTLTAYFDGAPSSDNSKRQVEFLLALDQETASENPGDGLVMSGVLTFDSAGKLQGMSAFVPGQAGSQDLSQWQAATAVGGGFQCNINGSPVTIDFGLGNATAAGGAATAAEVGTDATLLGGLTGLQEVFGYLLGHRTDRHRPAAELVSVVGEIFLVLRRHMLALHQRITLPGLQPAVAGYTAAVVEHLYCCLGYPDVHALANQVVGNGILVPAIRNKIVVGDLGNRPDGRFKRTDRQRQHVGLLFFQIGTAAASSHLLERAAVQFLQKRLRNRHPFTSFF